MAYPGKPERNRRIIEEYLGGMTRRELGEKYGLSPGRVSNILERKKVRLPEDERRRRFMRGASNIRGHNGGGRKPFWPDCPPELHGEYMRLRKNYGYRAAEAKAILEAEMAE